MTFGILPICVRYSGDLENAPNLIFMYECERGEILLIIPPPREQTIKNEWSSKLVKRKLNG